MAHFAAPTRRRPPIPAGTAPHSALVVGVAPPPAVSRAGPHRAAPLVALVMAMTLLAMAPAAAPGSAAAATERVTTADEVELVLFWGADCPHCTAEREFLVELEASHPSLVIRQYKVFGNEDNQRRFEERRQAAPVSARRHATPADAVR